MKVDRAKVKVDRAKVKVDRAKVTLNCTWEKQRNIAYNLHLTMSHNIHSPMAKFDCNIILHFTTAFIKYETSSNFKGFI